eukprot:TRINITY_DN22325_c0_g1_i1.p1 TRINITY_DN22325_c0_g1~~TRINITY_DN22325_c0_g1_i1.p1  ORF type:complete len:337 (-),score=49.47 TRINITY_DN22325_c0_g1_i1:166-1176(-)
MDVDLARSDWSSRAVFRWAVYAVLWTATVIASLLAAQHVVFQVGGALLACLLAASLPLIFATLFEAAYSRRARQDLPVICCPLVGALVVLIGAAAMQQASPLVIWQYSSKTFQSAAELSAEYSGVPRERLPRSACLKNAFVKTEWEAGQQECRNEAGHVACRPEYVAAPIFDDSEAAGRGLGEEIRAWGVTHGPHAVAAYQPDGSLCGYLQGIFDLDFHLGSYHLAVERILENHDLGLALPAETSAEAPAAVPLASRPLLFIADPATMAAKEEGWLLFALLLLGTCPCVGPVPLAVVFCFWCWSRHDDRYRGRGTVAVEDDDYPDDRLGQGGAYYP